MFFESTGTNRQARSQISHNRLSIKTGIKHEPTEIPGYLQLYQVPPGDDITIQEFDEIAMERLKLLKTFENCKDSHPVASEEFKNKLRKACEDVKLILFPDHKPLNQEEVAEMWRRDLIGHFILRLAFCRTPENQKWLTGIEADLLRHRLRLEREIVVDSALGATQIEIHKLSKAEITTMASQLSRSCQISTELDVMQRTFYRCRFQDAIELVRRGGIHQKHGYAFFAFEDLVTILVTKMRTAMSAAMARAFKHLALLEEEGRLLPRFALLTNNTHQGKEYTGEPTDGQIVITRHMIDKLYQRSFPMCMKQMHDHLRLNHHLKYGARRQYGLFLKGIGLSLDEAVAMMRDEFTKKMPSDKFEKEYGYNIRYMYGKEGRRVPQKAMSCATIILNNTPSAVDCHGCPFRHCDKQVLRQRLGKEKVLGKEQIDKIVELSDTHQYDKACTRFFEFTHKLQEGELGQLITHPNAFYEESQKIIGARIAAKTQSQSLAVAQPKEEKMDTD